MHIRKNAAFMTADEWQRYCTAIVTLKHTIPPGSTVSIYDQFVAMHLCVWGLRFGTGPQGGVDGAHGGPAFLPWHREYLRRYEAALMQVDPTVTLPYWNWGFGSAAETNDLFVDDKMGPRGSSITSGYFAQTPNSYNPLGWEVHPDLRPLGAALLRSGTSSTTSLPTLAAVLEALDLSLFSDFRPAIEAGTGLSSAHGGMHNGVHGWVGGDMGYMTSPNDPIFFMHHAQIDRLWAIWQRKHPGSANYNDAGVHVGQGHGTNDNMWPWDAAASAPGSSGSTPNPSTAAALLPNEAATDLVTCGDVLDTKALGYIYDGEEPTIEVDKTSVVVTDAWHTETFANTYTDKPAALACMQTFEGGDTAAVRLKDVTTSQMDIKIEEETSANAEVGHVAEAVGYLVGENGILHNVSGQAIGEVRKARLGQPFANQWDRFEFDNSYTSPVVVGQVSSFNGDNPVHIRIKNVTADGFDFQMEEWDYQDGHHYFEDISFVVVEAGDHRLQDGTLINADTATVDDNWLTVNFTTAFTADPVVLSQCMTHNGSDAVVTRQRNIAAGAFDLRLQEEEAKGAHVDETVGYIAFEQ